MEPTNILMDHLRKQLEEIRRVYSEVKKTHELDELTEQLQDFTRELQAFSHACTSDDVYDIALLDLNETFIETLAEEQGFHTTIDLINHVGLTKVIGHVRLDN